MAFGFLTNKEAQEKIQTLESRISELEETARLSDEQLTQARDENASMKEDVAPLKAENAELKQKVEDQKATISEQDAKINELTELNKITAEKISNEAARMLAATGHPEPVTITERKPSDTLSPEEFRKLEPLAQARFLRKGGQISA